MLSSDTDNLKFDKPIEVTNDDGDSTVNEISYGPGIVQKLCARFLQLSKEPNAVPLLRSPRFKRRKSSAENNFAVISEIRRCNTQTVIPSKPTNNVIPNATKSDMNFCDGEKCELHIVPPVKAADTVELNGTYLYHATVIPSDMKANRKAKKIESIREKFEKTSATSFILPHKKPNKAHFRREYNLLTVNTESSNRQPECIKMHGELRKAQHDESFHIKEDKSEMQPSVLSDTIRVVVKLSPSNDNLTVTQFSSVPTVSSLQNIDHFEQEEMNNDRRGRIEKDVNNEIGLNGSSQFGAISRITINTNTSVKMSGRKQSEQNGLQEVRRLLKKFNAIREQRAKKSIQNDMSDKTDNRYDTGDHNPLMQLQVALANLTSF
ncbi:unnamed protein product [Acanthocheilonema viteae]|uniref:Uncharacterized protein n=1 Tax=Acanthocheilonema viteae TaxID=6277 RepID=A0A498SRL9_ACAVI|nr:unnamed protein product [Acanthocheilonema viteae]